MTTTLDAATLDWRTNGKGTWRTLIEDIAANTTDISFSEGYTATVTGKKVTISNTARPTGTVTFATDSDNTAYVSLLASVGSSKDTLDAVTGDRTDKFDKLEININNYPSPTTYSSGSWRGFYLSSSFTTYTTRVGYIASNPEITSLPTTGSTAVNPHMWLGVNNSGLYLVWSTSATYVPSEWYDMENDTYNLNGFKAWLADNPFEVFYKKQTAGILEDTPQEVPMEDGTNFVNADNTDASYSTSYDGTDYTIATKSARKYIKTINGSTELTTGVSSVAVRGGRDNLIDLTRMFGAGLEPGTLDAFYNLFPTWRGYKLPYNNGSLLNFKGTGLKSVGFNLLDLAGRTLGEPQYTAQSNTTIRGIFDETKYYVGMSATNYYTPSSVKAYTITSNSVYVKTNGDAYGVAFPIRVIPGQVYRFENWVSTRTRFAFYTYNGTFLEQVYTTEYAETPANAYWCLVCFVTTDSTNGTTVTDPCVHLQWSGTRNGDYETYWDYVRPIPTLTYFPDGMNGRGQVYDEINPRQAVKRFGKVDLGTLEWTPSGNGVWTTTFSGMKSSSPAIIPSEGYDISASGTTLTVTSDSEPVGDMVYELATPVITTFPEEISATARISDYGTEECLPVNGYDPVTAPFRGMVLYQDDYARTITKLPENYISKESMEALLTLLGSLHNGNISMTYNQSTTEYNFSFTPNA